MSSSAPSVDLSSEFAAEVRAGLGHDGQKTLPSKYLYDDIGSLLFEVICLLPEYGVTRADERVLRGHADEIAERMGFPAHVVELGAGTGKKTRWILGPLCRRQPTIYYPIEISPAALEICRQELASLESLTFKGFEGTYLKGMEEVGAQRPKGESLAVLFLGSTLGNFDGGEAEWFLSQVQRSMMPGDALLLGTDLVKPLAQLLPAYNDSLGITAAFNLNVLARMNRDLGANFDLSRFRHDARYNSKASRIEMHLVSEVDQSVSISHCDLVVSFRKGETIRTESCRKFKLDEALQMAKRTGFRCKAQWIDEEWPFAVSLFVAV